MKDETFFKKFENELKEITRYRQFENEADEKYSNTTNSYTRKKYSKLCDEYSMINENLTEILTKKIKKGRPKLSKYEIWTLIDKQVEKIRKEVE